MSYKSRKQGNYGSPYNRKSGRKGMRQFPKKQLNQLLKIERKLDNLQGGIDYKKFDDIHNDILEADSKLWKAISKADKTRSN